MIASNAARLRDYAQTIAQRAEVRLVQLDAEYLALQTRMTEVEIERDLLRGAPERLSNFTVHSGSYYHCPRCWVRDALHTNLKSVRVPGDEEDTFSCEVCSASL